MPKLIVKKTWRSATRTYEPGAYEIPADVGMTDAKCCRADGAGEIELPGKAVPAEKAFRAAPENKAPMGRGGGRGKRSKSHR